MKKIFYILSAVLLFAGCAHTTCPVPGRSKVPAESLSGSYQTTYSTSLDGEESLSSPEGYLELRPDSETNSISGFMFVAYLYDSQHANFGYPGQYEVIPEPGGLCRIMSINYISMPVAGRPYDGNFEGSFYGRVEFYGDDAATMYRDLKTFSDVWIHMEGWMKERRYLNNSKSHYNCEVTMEFTVDGIDYIITVTDAQNRDIIGA